MHGRIGMTIHPCILIIPDGPLGILTDQADIACNKAQSAVRWSARRIKGATGELHPTAIRVSCDRQDFNALLVIYFTWVINGGMLGSSI